MRETPTGMARSHSAHERGQTSAEWVGMLAVVAAMVAVLVAAGPGIGGTLRDVIASIFGGGQSGGGAPVNGGPLAGPAGPLPPIDYDGPGSGRPNVRRRHRAGVHVLDRRW